MPMSTLCCLKHGPSMGKGFPSKGDGDYFENLPNELVIFIFTKLSSTNNKVSFLEDIQSLGRCSVVSKRFNALTFLVPTLSIQHGCMKTLYSYCPKILKKFKHIRSLQITHWSCTESEMMRRSNLLPIVYWGAAYRPHSYCLAVASYKQISHYSDDSEKLKLIDADAAAKDKDFIELNREHTLDMIYLHHMLVSSIKDHEYLERLVITDFYGRGTLTLEKDMLVELRNCTSTNLEHVLVRDRSGSVANLDVPFGKPRFLMNNVFCNIIEWWDKDTTDHVHKDFDGDGVIPSVLPLNCPGAEMVGKVLTSFMENPIYMKTNRKVIFKVLSDIRSEGHLF